MRIIPDDTFRFKLLFLSTFVLIFSVLVLSGQIFARTINDDPQEIEQAITQANSLSTAFRAASKKVIPFVVKIETKTKSTENPQGVQDFFPFGPRSRRGGTGLGTGIIVDTNGLILTNNHVVEDADSILVILSDGREFEVENVKTDKNSDLAILKIKADGLLPYATFADSDDVEVGDWVLAIGNPFDLESTVSVGIISARWRPLEGVDRGDFLQTDAAINPGNSGGPLVNLRGEVVGINTAIASRTGSNSGIGFANASNTAKWVMQQLREKGKVERAYLGVKISPVDAKLASKMGGKPREGVHVTDSAKENNLKKDDAGSTKENILKKDDIILSFDGRTVNSPSELQSIVERADVEKKHKVTVIRDKKTTELEVTVAHMDPQTIYQSRANGDAKSFYNDKLLGLRLIEINPDYQRQHKFENLEGVAIYHVDPKSQAERSGIETGMCIIKLNDTPVKTLNDYIAASEKASLEEGVTLILQSADGEKTVTIKKK